MPRMNITRQGGTFVCHELVLFEVVNIFNILFVTVQHNRSRNLSISIQFLVALGGKFASSIIILTLMQW